MAARAPGRVVARAPGRVVARFFLIFFNSHGKLLVHSPNLQLMPITEGIDGVSMNIINDDRTPVRATAAAQGVNVARDSVQLPDPDHWQIGLNSSVARDYERFTTESFAKKRRLESLIQTFGENISLKIPLEASVPDLLEKLKVSDGKLKEMAGKYRSTVSNAKKIINKNNNLYTSREAGHVVEMKRVLDEVASLKGARDQDSERWVAVKAELASTRTQVEEANRRTENLKAENSAARTGGILALMQELWDDERSGRTTFRSVGHAWDGGRRGGGGGGEQRRASSDSEGYRRDDERRGDGRRRAPSPLSPGFSGAIAPNTSSYNSVLKAWSRCSGPDASLHALGVYRSMVGRGNVASSARDSLVRGGTTAAANDGDASALPDSRTFVLLLQSLRNLPASIGFRDALDAVERIVDSAKRWDEQIRWSAEHNLAPPPSYPDGGDAARTNRQLLNVFSYNTLIKTLSQLPSSWEESHECCLRIDDIVEGMDFGASSVRANAVTAWKKCAAHAGEDKERLRLCAEKSGSHVDAFMDSMKPSTTGNNRHESLLIQAVSDAISLYGRAGMPSRADELFRRAKSRNAHNLGTLSTVIDALCENGLEDIAHVDKARQYLLDFEAEKLRMSRLLVTPDMKYTKMYNAVIAGYLGCGTKRRGLEQAEALLEHMISSHESNPRHIARPNTTSFARVMSALSQRGDNTRQLEVLLKKMEALNHRRKSVLKNSKDAELVANVVPNIVCYNTLLKAYARSNDDEALQSAMKLLGRMEADPDITPDAISNSYILALLSRENEANVSGTTSYTIKYVSHALDVDNLRFEDLNLNGRSDPTSKSFNSIMNGKLIYVFAKYASITKAIHITIVSTSCFFSACNKRDRRGCSERCRTTTQA